MLMSNGTSISVGNRKMGSIPSVSLMPGVSCVENAPCLKDCYAANNCPGTLKSWKRNMEVLTDDPVGYMDDIKAFLAREPPFFRWHVGGDIPSHWYLYEMTVIAQMYEAVKFLCFTKRWLDLSFEQREIPRNLSIVLSMWPTLKRTGRQRLPRAWIMGDPRIPSDALECPGNCATCAMCWNLNEIGRDVMFPKH